MTSLRQSGRPPGIAAFHWGNRLLLLFRFVLIALTNRRLEVLDTFPQTLAQTRQLAWTKNQQGNGEDHQDVQWPQSGRHYRRVADHISSTLALTIRHARLRASDTVLRWSIRLAQHGRPTVQSYLRPEVQAELARQATAHGRAIEPYAASLLEEAVHLPAAAVTNAEKRKREGENRLVVEPQTKPRYTLDELLDQCDAKAPVTDEDRTWLDIARAGQEL